MDFYISWRIGQLVYIKGALGLTHHIRTCYILTPFGTGKPLKDNNMPRNTVQESFIMHDFHAPGEYLHVQYWAFQIGWMVGQILNIHVSV